MPEHKHCDHEVGYNANPSGQPYWVVRCCWCGREDITHHQPQPVHGPYLHVRRPMQDKYAGVIRL